MKHSKIFLFTVVTMLSVFSAVIYTSCQKDPQCNYVCLNGSACVNGACRCLSGYYGLECQYTKIIYKNNTFTTISISLTTKIDSIGNLSHDTTIYLKAAQTAEYFGLPTDSAFATAYTFGPFGPSGGTTDVVFGATVVWNKIKTAFAKNGTGYVEFNVRPDYFFLQIDNRNPMPIGSNNIINIAVNNGYFGATDTIRNTPGAIPLYYNGGFTVVNDSFVHNVGYFGGMYGSSVIVSYSSGASAPQQFTGLQFNINQSYLMYVP